MNQFLSVAREAALVAGKVVMEIRRSNDLGIRIKEDNTPVSRADLAAQEAILTTLHRYFNHQVRSEELPYAEGVFVGKDSPETWILDPIDGTEEFISGGDAFSISIAYAYRGEVLAGVVYAPALEQLYHAARGEGAFLNDQPVHVRPIQNLEEASLLLTPEQRQREIYQKILHTLRVKPRIRKLSISLKAAFIACGEANLYIKRGPTNEWDIAAGDLLIQEARGILTDLSGRRIVYTDKDPRHILGLCAGNKSLQPKALKMLQKGLT